MHHCVLSLHFHSIEKFVKKKIVKRIVF